MAKNPGQTRAGQIRGFTLLDLIITLTVATILLSLAVPNFSAAIQNNRMTTQVNELNTALSLGRSEAAGQKAAQDNIIGRVLGGGPVVVPRLVKLLDRYPLLRRIPGRIIGLGFRRERVKSPVA